MAASATESSEFNCIFDLERSLKTGGSKTEVHTESYTILHKAVLYRK